MNTKTTILLLLNFLFFGLISLTSCEKEEEIKKTELGEAVSEIKPNEEEEQDPTECERIDYTTEIITSNWEIQQNLYNKEGTDIDFFDEDFGVVASKENALVTTDGGKSWVSRPTSMTHTNNVQTLGKNKFCIAGNGLYESSNGGMSFSVFGDESNANTRSFFGLYIFDTAHFMAYHRSVEVTRNGGKDWIRHDSLFQSKVQFFGNELGYAAGGYVSGGTTEGFFSEGYVHKTLNGGDTWKLLNLKVERITAMYFTDENTGIVAENIGILHKTTDGGNTWNVLSQDLCGYYAWDMIFTDDNKGYIASSYGIIFKTEDGGQTWKVDYYSGHNSSGYERDFTALAKTPNNTVYVTGHATMKRK
ncbi:WD40/YVTN/BNR-like repeat-containing protein [Bernardetia sp. OM2101]|uniref:WD40/YVTN/BNR-like repeat-containing protein n=1 Tax=Bernardetia sp. OM2101 TaxID=3344876 RepID=UPI0035CEAAA2